MLSSEKSFKQSCHLRARQGMCIAYITSVWRALVHVQWNLFYYIHAKHQDKKIVGTTRMYTIGNRGNLIFLDADGTVRRL